ncbi:MAG: TonB-dependent receptor [Bacteriovoracaceae bacterium]
MKFLILLLFFTSLLSSQQKAILSGFVRDKANKESLPYATVSVKELKIGTATNIEGYYAIPNIPEGEFTVVVSLLGYQAFTFKITTTEKKRLIQDILLSDQVVQVSEVIIEAEKDEGKRSTQTGRISMQAKDIAQLPTIGEADVFRALQMMPGVKATSEISTGLNIRGGSTDQNLILLDGTVVYNPSHLFGFFSTFNNDAIKDIVLMKGGFPAEYGGRLSSVLNVTNIDGDRVSTHGKASISLLSTRVTGEGPIGNGSWFLSGRRTYFDQLVSFAGLDTGKDALPLYFFYDANAKLNQDIGENDKLSFVGYFGDDDLTYKIGNNEIELNMLWGNRTGALKWTHVFSQTLFTNFTASYSRYKATIGGDFGGTGFSNVNSVQDYSLRSDVDFFVSNNHLMKIGVWWSQYDIQYRESFDGEPYLFNERPAQISFYGQDEWTINERWKIQFGLRVEYQDLTKHITFGPRYNARYNIDEYSTLKFAAGMYYQFLNAVPAGSDNGFSPFDIWIPLNEKMDPSSSTDFVLGYETSYYEDIKISFETYFKFYKDVLLFKREITQTLEVDQLFNVGSGRAYGFEFFLQKQVGQLTGMVGYTLAWTHRTFPELNDAKEFMPKFDRRNDLTLAGNYQFNDLWKLSSVFTFSTGQSYTPAAGMWIDKSSGTPITRIEPGPLYSKRLLPYHRWDLSLHKKITMFDLDGSWYFQVFNVYNYRNIWFKNFDYNENPVEVTDVKLLPIIPSFGVEFKF